LKEALLENDFCVEEEVLPKNDLEERNREDDDKDDEEEETEEEEEHVVVVGFIIIIAFTRRHTKCCMCTCLVLCGNSDVRIFKNLPNARKTPDIFPRVMELKMQDEQREECSCS
jgi:hypothetical protein